MNKRLKSFGIIVGSMFLTALVAVIPTVEFSNLLGWIKDVVSGWGVPGVVWAFVSAFVSQVWFAWRNSVKVKKEGFSGVASASAESSLDLY